MRLPSNGRIRSPRAKLQVDPLEARCTPAILTVNSSFDDSTGGNGKVTLREAIIAANNDTATDGGGTGSGADTIVFASSLNGQTIMLGGTQLPNVTTDLTIQGPSANLLTINGANLSRILQIGAAATVNVSGLTLASGSAATGGGGAITNAGTLTINNSSLSMNTSNQNGGGAISTTGTLTISGSTFSNNVAGSDGGAIVSTGAVTVTNSTFSGNTTNLDGGAISNFTGTLTVTNSTIVRNRADAEGNGTGVGGGISTSTGSTTKLLNSIVAGNLRGTGTVADDLRGISLQSGSVGNVIGNPSTAGGLTDGSSNVVGSGGGILPLASIVDVSLAFNGGPTLTHALAIGSPAIDKGIASVTGLTTDQRGTLFTRFSFGVDAGAVESRILPTVTVDSTADVDDGDYSTGKLTLREALSLNNAASLGVDSIRFATALNGQTITLGGTQLPTILDNVTITGRGAALLTIDGNNLSRIVEISSGVTAQISGLTLTHAKSSGDGGAIRNNGTLTATSLSIVDNTSNLSSGAGIRNTGMLTLANSILSGNIASLGGGGISNSGTLIVTNTEFVSNRAGINGGGIVNSGTLTVMGSTFASNVAIEAGGAISNTGSLTLTNGTLSANTSRLNGGAILTNSMATVTNSTLALNRADSDGNATGTGGGIFVTAGATTLLNTIIAGNLRGTGTTADDLAGIAVQAASIGNLIGDPNSAGGLTNNASNIIGGSGSILPLAQIVDVNLAFNGGFTRTHALATGSAALNKGIAAVPGLLSDQRGTVFARNIGGVDVGAVEFQMLPTVMVDSVSDIEDGDYSAGKLTLREALSLNNVSGLGVNTIRFASTLNGQTIRLGGTQLPVILDNVNIEGPGANLLTIDGNNLSRILEIASGVSARVTGLTLTQGSSSTNGGAILNEGMLTVSEVSLTANKAQRGGGIRNNGSLIVSDSTLSGNIVFFAGGAISNSGTLNLTNSTISGNQSEDSGGGIGNLGNMTITNTTIVFNRADSEGNGSGIGGGISTDASGATTLLNTIVAGNLRGMGMAADDISNKPVESGSIGNVIGSPTSAGGLTNNASNVVVSGGGILAIGLIINEQLVSNGGPTFTHALATGSAALNKGIAAVPGLLSDQRGTLFARNVGGIDVGAVESQTFPTLTVDSVSDIEDGDYSAGKLTLREALSLNNVSGLGVNTIRFASTLNGQTIRLGGTQLPVILDNVNIEGPGANLLTIDGNNLSRIMTTAAMVELSGLTLTRGNPDDADGGSGIYNIGTLVIRNSVFSANLDGAIRNLTFGTLTVIGSALIGNSWQNGGGITNSGTLMLMNSTLSGNVATFDGGGVFNGGMMTLTNTTIVFNRADSDGNGSGDGGGIFTLNGGTTKLINTIVAGNLRGIGTATRDLMGDVESTSVFNLISDPASAAGLTNTNGNIIGNGAGNLRPLSQILNPLLSDNGGSTFTHALIPGSAALNTGDPNITTADQRGLPTNGPRDIGAFENQGVTLLPVLLPDGILGMAYTQSLTASGGFGAFIHGLSGGTLPEGLTLSTGGTISGTPTTAGNFSFSITVSAASGDFSMVNRSITITPALPPINPPVNPPGTPPVVPPVVVVVPPTLPVTPPVNPPGTPPINPPILPPLLANQFAVGADVGAGTAKFFNTDNTERFTLTPFGADFTGGIRTATGDFNADGVDDIVVGTGPGRSTRVLVLDGVTQTQLFAVDPFEAAFIGGVFVAAGDLNGDGRADLIITPDQGGGPRARIFSGDGFGQIADFFGIDDANFRGGARAAVGDINNDGRVDLIVAAGFGGGPRVAAFNGMLLTANGGPKLFSDFFAFEITLRDGTFITSGDINGDGFAELIAGGGPGGGPRVSAFDGKTLLRDTQTRISDFFAGDINNRGGVRIATKFLNSDGIADLIAGAGTGAGSRVTTYSGATLTADTPPELSSFEAFPGLTNGVFVG